MTIYNVSNYATNKKENETTVSYQTQNEGQLL